MQEPLKNIYHSLSVRSSTIGSKAKFLYSETKNQYLVRRGLLTLMGVCVGELKPPLKIQGQFSGME